MRVLSFSLIAVLGILSSACSERVVGSKSRPFTMYFVPSVDAEAINTHGAKLATYVSQKVSQELYGKDEGFFVKTAVPTSYVAVVEAIGTKKADFVIFTTYAYILAKDIKGYPIDAVYTVLRGEHHPKATTAGQIITRAGSGIKKIEDLKGKKIAFVDPASLTGFVLPTKLLNDNKVTVGETVFAQKHDNVVTMVYQGQVDAGATYYQDPETKNEGGKEVRVLKDARARVLTQFPDVESKVSILAVTPEVPGEPWAIRTNLFADQQMNEKVRKAVLNAVSEFVKTSDGKVLLDQVATGVGLQAITDKDYDLVRDMVKEAQVNIEQVIAGQKR